MGEGDLLVLSFPWTIFPLCWTADWIFFALYCLGMDDAYSAVR